MRRCTGAGLIVCAMLAARAAGGTTFNVTVGDSTANSPWGDLAFPEAYFIDGVENPALTLVRGQTYQFKMVSVPLVHPFIITTTPEGGGASVLWNDGVTNQGAAGNQTLTFVVPEAAPDLLYYACHNHQRMGWQLLIQDPPCLGDLNGDSMIDLGDLSILLTNFGTSSGASPEDGDLNGDEAVDLTDLSMLLVLFGLPCA